MSRTLTASDRSTLIKMAAALPAGSPERKAILAGLRVAETPLKEQTFTHPVTKNEVKFTSLPKEEQAKIRSEMKGKSKDVDDKGKGEGKGEGKGKKPGAGKGTTPTRSEMKGLGLDHKDLDKAEAAIKKRLKDWDKAGPGFEKVWGADSKKKHEQLLREIQNIDHSPPSKEASDRSHLIRLASSMPKGSEMRRAILSGLRNRR